MSTIAGSGTIGGVRYDTGVQITLPPVGRRVAYGWNAGGWWRTGGQTASAAYTQAKAGFRGLPGILRVWPNTFGQTWGQMVPSFAEADKVGVFVNLGSDVAGVNAGRHDGEFETTCSTAPTDRPVWVSFSHEPENDNIRIPDWQRAQARLAAISAGSHVRFVSLLMGSTFIPSRFGNSAPGNRPASEWFDFDMTNVDALGTDIYQWGKSDPGDTAALVIQPCIDLARAKGKGLVVGEFGSRCLLSDGARAKFLRDAVTLYDANSDVVEAVAYFENDNGALAPWNLLPKPGTNPPAPNLPLSVAAWADAIASN